MSFESPLVVATIILFLVLIFVQGGIVPRTQGCKMGTGKRGYSSKTFCGALGVV